MSLFSRQRHRLRGLRFGNISGESPRDCPTLRVNLKHELRGRRWRMMENLHQNLLHKIHRRVIVVVQDNVKRSRSSCADVVLLKNIASKLSILVAHGRYPLRLL